MRINDRFACVVVVIKKNQGLLVSPLRSLMGTSYQGSGEGKPVVPLWDNSQSHWLYDKSGKLSSRYVDQLLTWRMIDDPV